MAIVLADSLLPNKTGVPVDGRTVAANAASLASIENPYIGMHVWISDPGKEVIVKTLKDQTVGAFTKKVIDTTEDAVVQSDLTTLQTSLSGKADTSVTSALDTRVSALEISGGGTTVTAQTFSSAPNNKVAFTGNIPVGVTTNSGKYYPVEKGSLTISGGVATLDVTPYLAYDNSASFSGTWTAYFATGTAPSFVLDWIAPDHTRATDIPAWNTTYQAANACWVSVDFLGGTTGGVTIGPSPTDLNGTPFGIWVGASGITGIYTTIFCPKGWYYHAILENVDASLSYSHKKVYICKGA